MGWSGLENGALLTAAEAADFAALLTTDRNLKYQQNLSGRRIAFVVQSTTSWPRIQKNVAEVAAALSKASGGSYREVEID